MVLQQKLFNKFGGKFKNSAVCGSLKSFEGGSSERIASHIALEEMGITPTTTLFKPRRPQACEKPWVSALAHLLRKKKVLFELLKLLLRGK